MFDEVNGKPVRGVLANVRYSRMAGNCVGTLVSPDFCEGQEGRNYLEKGEGVLTSGVVSFNIVEDKLVIETYNSAYVVEGTIETGELHLSKSMGLKYE